MSNTSVEAGVRIFGRDDVGYPLIRLEDPRLAQHAAALVLQCLKRFGDYSTRIATLNPNFLTAEPPIPASRVGAVATALCQGGFREAQVQLDVGFATVTAESVPQMQPGYVDYSVLDYDDGEVA